MVFVHARWSGGDLGARRYELAALLAACSFVFFVQVYAYHFHAHTPFFRSARLNRAFDVAYSAVNAEPHSFYTYQHLRHHDPAVLAADTKYSRFGPLRGALTASGLLNPLFYAQQLDVLRLYWAFALFATRKPPPSGGRPGEPRAPRRYSWHRKRGDVVAVAMSPLLPPYVVEWGWLGRQRGHLAVMIAEVAGIIGLRLALIALAPRFFFFVWLPWSAVLFAVRSYTDFVDHYGADVSSPTAHSVSCYGRVFNLVTFNSGYHIEHHASPGVHWSTYPSIRPKMAPESDRRVIPRHLWLNPFFTRRCAMDR